MSLICPMGQPLKRSVVATVWRSMCAVTGLGKRIICRNLRNRTSAALSLRGFPRRPTTKSASPWSLRRVTYSVTQLSARGLKNSTRSLLPLPMIVASPVWKLMELRFSDNASDIRAPVPRSTSTSTRKPSQSTSYERGPVADRNCCDILLNLIGREELHFPFRNARQADLPHVHGFQAHRHLAEAQERFQRREN